VILLKEVTRTGRKLVQRSKHQAPLRNIDT